MIGNKLIIELFYSTGMRLTELINLKITDVDFYNNQLKVLGKRNKERIIPFSQELKLTIENYLAVKKQVSNNEFLLTLNSGKKL